MNESFLAELIALVAEILDIDKSRLLPASAPSDFIEWDSLANMAIFAEISEHFDASLLYADYVQCTNISELSVLVSRGLPDS